MSTAILRRTNVSRATAGNLSTASNPISSDDSAISNAVSVLIHHRSKSRWSTLQSLFPSGFTPHQITHILRNIKLRNNPTLAHCFFNFALKHSPSPPLPLHCYASIIHILARVRLKNRALTLLKDAIRINQDDHDDDDEVRSKRPKLFRELVETYRVCDSSPVVFDWLIEALLQANKLDPCIEIVRLMRSRGFVPHVMTCNKLISGALRRKGCDFGYDLYLELCNDNVDHNDGEANNVKKPRRANRKLVPNVHTFNELMLAFHRDGSVEMVEEFWIQMARWNCTPKVCSYSILMTAYCERGAMEKAENVWGDLRAKGLRPDVVAFNTLIGGYCRIGEMEKAEKFHTEMESGGLKGNCVTYQHLINGYCLHGHPDSAMLVYKDMRAKGICPDNSTLNTMVKIVCDRKSVSEALELFKSLMEDADFVASGTSYWLLIKGLCSEGKMTEALKLQAQMVGKGFKPESHMYEAFIDGYTKLGKPDMAERLREEMIASEG